jgi:F-type H+-transporting ATPase subunit b
MHFDASFFVAVAFLLFIGLLIWKKVPGLIIAALDQRAAEIKAQLEEARQLRDEAQALLAQHQREQRNAATQAQEIAEQAEREAKMLEEAAKKQLDAAVERRLSLAQEKIAQAEAAAVKEVRQVAIQAAVAAARRLIAEQLKAQDDNALIKDAIDSLDKRLH